MSDGSESSDVRVTFLLEQHLGHLTYADNLRSATSNVEGIDANWVPITYRRPEPPWLPDSAGRLLGPLAGRREVRRGLREHPADVDVFNTQVPAALAGRAIRTPYIVVTDVTPVQYDAMAEGYQHKPDRFAPTAWWKDRVNRRVFQRAARCVGWSSWVTKSYVDDYGVRPELTDVIPPGVDTSVWRPGDDTPDDSEVRLLFVGGDLERKGGDILVDLMESLPDNVSLTLVTKTPVASSERIRVIDDIGPNDPRLIELFRSSDVFVLPTKAETFGIAAVEASASGLPVVATDVGGLSDIVGEGSSGFLTPLGDHRALVAALDRLVGDAELRRRFGRAGRQRAVESFDGATNARRLLDVARTVAL